MMETRDWLTLIALVTGPVLAVVIAFWMESRRRARDNQLRIVRMLVATRHLAAHPDYNAAINLVPVEFNDCSEVMTAWREYIREVNTRPATPEDKPAQDKRMAVKQARLIYETMIAAGLKLSEGDIQTEAYVSVGFTDRDALYLKSLAAMPEIAETLKRQAAFTEKLLDLARAGRPPPPAPPAV